MTIEILYKDGSNTFIENIKNVSVGKKVYFSIDDEAVSIEIEELKTFGIFTDDWKTTLRHWVFK